MPPGAKKRKALKKKMEQEAIGASTNNRGFNGHGHDEHGSQDETESDGNLSSPRSQGNGEFWTRDLSPSPLSGLGKVTINEKTEDADLTRGKGANGEDVIAVERRKDHVEISVDKPPISFPENFTYNTRKAASQETDGIAPVVDSVKPVGSIDENNQVESSMDSDSVKQRYNVNEEYPRVKATKEGNSLGSAAETSKESKSVNESEVPECSEEKSLLPSGPPVVRTSWLSCCGLFDVIPGSER